VFALPGNPASALNCFYVYVHLALKLWEGDAEASISFRQATITADFNKKGDRAQFLKAKIGANNTVEILNGQASSMLQSFAVADALVYMEEDMGFVAKNTSVRYLKID
jgi:molybdopterin molybdotransferase